MYSSKKTKFLNILCIILALSPGLIRLTRHHFPNVSSNSLICVLYMPAAQRRTKLSGFCSFADRFPDGYPYNKIYIYPGKYSCSSIYLVSLLFSPDLCGTFYVFCCVIYRKALRLFHFSQMEAAAHPCTSHRSGYPYQ